MKCLLIGASCNDTMGRMHSDTQFAGSSSVPAHVEMMGFLGIPFFSSPVVFDFDRGYMMVSR